MSNEKIEKIMSLLKPYTNNDRINDMSIEKKAVFLQTILECCFVEDCENCPMNAVSPCNLSDIELWLESEAAL